MEFIDNMSGIGPRYVGRRALLDTDRSSAACDYVQDEIKLGHHVIISRASLDHYEEFVRVTPRAAVIVLPSSAQSFKYLYGDAFRAPNENELNVVYFGERVTELRPESIDTHELVWERYVNDRLRTAVSTYWYRAEGLITPIVDQAAFLGVSFVNQGQVRAKGLELEAQMRLKGDSRALVSYALQSAVDQQTELGLANTPRHIAKARISMRGLTRESSVSIEGRYLSSRTTLAGPPVSGAASVNLHLVQPLGRSWELAGGVRNVFGTAYLDPVSDQHRQHAIEQNGRTARIGFNWKLWQP